MSPPIPREQKKEEGERREKREEAGEIDSASPHTPAAASSAAAPSATPSSPPPATMRPAPLPTSPTTSPAAPSLPPAEDLNTADLARLRAALSAQSKIAERIIGERELHGPFSSFRDLQKRVRGLGPVKLDMLRAAQLYITAPHEQTEGGAQQEDEQLELGEEEEAGDEAAAEQGDAVKEDGQPIIALPPPSSHPQSVAVDPPPSVVFPVASIDPSLLPTAAAAAFPAPLAHSMHDHTGESDKKEAAAASSDTSSSAYSFLCCGWWCCHPTQTAASSASAARQEQELSPTLKLVGSGASVLPYPPVPSPTSMASVESNIVAPVPAIIPAPAPEQELEMEMTALRLSPPPSVSTPSSPPPPTLRFGSWNLCHFNHSKSVDSRTMSTIADVLVRNRFDVMVLLEVRDERAVHTLVDSYLNHPQRPLPPTHQSHEPATDDAGVGAWKCVVSECVEYGSSMHTWPFSNPTSPEQQQQQPRRRSTILEAEIVEETILTEGAQTTAVHASHKRIASAVEVEEQLVDGLATLKLEEQTSSIRSTDGTLTFTHSSTTTTTTSAALTTPIKKRQPSHSVSSPQSAHHRRATGSMGSAGTPKRGHRKKEYYAFVYRADRVELPQGCRLYQTKATPASPPPAPAAPSSPLCNESVPAASNDCATSSLSSCTEEHTWWRSPCYALVRPLPHLLPSDSSTSSPALHWLLTACHAIFGNGKEDVLRECSHLEHLHARLTECIHDESEGDSALTASAPHSFPSNCAIALLGDFNINYNDSNFSRHCLPAEEFQPLILKPHSTTFSAHNFDCNCYDNFFVQRSIIEALRTSGTETPVSPAVPTPTSPPPSSHPTSPLRSGVVYFDSTYFPASDPTNLSSQALSRGEAKKLSDHRPIYVDVPCVGEVQGKVRPTKTAQPLLQKVAVADAQSLTSAAGENTAETEQATDHAPASASSPESISEPASAPAPSSASSSLPSLAPTSSPLPSLSPLLSILVVTSAIPLHPSTEVLDYLMHSFTLMPELDDVPVYILCDWPKEVVPDPVETQASETPSADANIYKRGVLTASRLQNYLTYVSNLRQNYAHRSHVHIIQLPTYHGFAWAIREAIQSHVRTPYMLICQHDYIFTMSVPIRELVAVMEESSANSTSSPSPSSLPPINYIGFIHKSTQNYLRTSERGMPGSLRTDPLHRLFQVPVPASATSSSSPSSSPSSLLLCPLLFLYDKNHLARTSYYRDTILLHPRLTRGPGGFVEDEFGVEQIEEIRRSDRGMQVWRDKYATFLYYPDEKGVKIALRHIHGRRFDQQRMKGLRKMQPTHAPTDRNQAERVEEEGRTGQQDADDDSYHGLFDA